MRFRNYVILTRSYEKRYLAYDMRPRSFDMASFSEEVHIRDASSLLRDVLSVFTRYDLVKTRQGHVVSKCDLSYNEINIS